MLIQVTADHIAKGRRWQPTSCPIALALTDVGFEKVRVGMVIRVGQHKIPLTQEVREFMRAFDIAHNAEPFSFEFNARLPLYQRLRSALTESIARLSR